MKNKVVTVFGGSGFLGRYVVEALLRQGAQVRVAERHPKMAWEAKAQANLGQIAFMVGDIAQPASLVAPCAGADAVINLVGSFADMQTVHVDGAANIAKAAALAGVGALVHVSAIGADADSPSNYGRTKGEGEAAVRAAFPDAAIVRPSIVFGREDQFINRFAGLIRMAPVMPVIGGTAQLQPVYVGDVAKAIVAALARPGETFELGGPQILTMAQLNSWIADRAGYSRFFLDVPNAMSSAIATLTGWLPGAPITRDQWKMLQRPNVVAAGAKGLDALGVEATALDTVAPGWLTSYRRHGRFGTTG